MYQAFANFAFSEYSQHLPMGYRQALEFLHFSELLIHPQQRQVAREVEVQQFHFQLQLEHIDNIRVSGDVFEQWRYNAHSKQTIGSCIESSVRSTGDYYSSIVCDDHNDRSYGNHDVDDDEDNGILAYYILRLWKVRYYKTSLQLFLDFGNQILPDCNVCSYYALSSSNDPSEENN